MRDFKERLRHPSRLAWILLCVLVLLLAARAALPPLVKHYANQKMARMKDYRGEIGDLDISIIRGAVRLENFKLVKTGGKVPVPFLEVGEADASVQWKELIHGRIVAEIELDRPKVNFVDGPTPQQSQKKIDKGWRDVITELLPLKINRIAIRDGEIHFRNLHSKPPVDIHLKEVTAEARNLSNSAKVAKDLPSSATVRGLAMGDAPFRLNIKLNALKDPIDFDLDSELKQLPLKKLNSFFRAYANVDIESGTLTLASELAAKNGALTGYAKPSLKNLDVVEIDKDAKKGPFALFWQSLAGTVGDVLQHDDRQAMRIPIEGSLKNPKTGTLSAIGSAIGHAFGKPLPPGLEHSVNLEDARKQAAGRKGDAAKKD
jgi:hypothetical protein